MRILITRTRSDRRGYPLRRGVPISARPTSGSARARDRRPPPRASCFHPHELVLEATRPARQRRLARRCRARAAATAARAPRQRFADRVASASRPDAVGDVASGSSPIDAPLRNSFCAYEQRRQPGRDALDERLVVLLALLDLLPVGHDLARRRRPRTSPNTCGWRRTSLSCTAARDVGDRERAGLRREHRLDHHLEQQVAELVFERVVRADRDVAGRRVGGSSSIASTTSYASSSTWRRKRVMRLRRVPRATARAAQPLGEREQPRELAGHRDRSRCRRTTT